MSKLYPSYINLCGGITLIQQIVKRTNRYINLSKVCMYSHTYTTEHIYVTSFNVEKREGPNANIFWLTLVSAM